MARAVIKFQADINSLLPELCREIPGCVYNPATHEGVFNSQGQIVNIHPQEIIIFDSVKESDAHELMLWLQGIGKQLKRLSNT
jgi:hypothetical protein